MKKLILVLALLTLTLTACKSPKPYISPESPLTVEACLAAADAEALELATLAAGPEPPHTRSGVERQDREDWAGHLVTLQSRYAAMTRERCADTSRSPAAPGS